MYSTFSWVYEAKGSVEYVANPRKPANVTEAVGFARPNVIPKASTIGAGAGLSSPSRPKALPEFGSDMSEPQAKYGNNTRPGHTKKSADVFGASGSGEGLDEDDLPFAAYRKFHAYLERISKLDQQLNIMQTMINDTLRRDKNLENEIKVIGNKISKRRGHQTEPNTNNLTSSRQHRTIQTQEEARDEAENEDSMLELQGQLKDVQTEIRNLSSEHTVQKYHLTKVANNRSSEDWENLASQSNKLLGKWNIIANRVRDSISSYLEKYDKFPRTTMSNYLEIFQKQFEEGNFELWNKEGKKTGDFEEILLQDYSKNQSWYQHEIKQLQGEKSIKEMALEQLRIDFSNERQKLENEHKERLAAQAAEYSRLMENQRRKHDWLVNWHSRRINEKTEKWQERVTSLQKENTRLIHTRGEEQAAYLKETQKAGEDIRNLVSDLTKKKQEFDAIEKLNEELEILLKESMQKVPDELQALRKEIKELDVGNKAYLEEIERLRKAEKNLDEQSKELEFELKKCQQEVIECRVRLAKAPQQIQELEDLHDKATKRLKDEYDREKTLAEEEHERRIRTEREKMERLEQLAESLRISKHEQAEQHYIYLEENTRKWQDDADKMRTEWQKELDQSYALIREAKASLSSKDAKIGTLQQEAKVAQTRIQDVTSELDQTREDQKSTLKACENLELLRRGAEKEVKDLRQALEAAQDKIQSITSKLDQNQDAQKSALITQEEPKISKHEAKKELSDLRQVLEGVQNEKESLRKKVVRLETIIQNATGKNELLDIDLETAQETLTTRTKGVSAIGEESTERKQRLTALQSQVEQTRKQLADAQAQITQKDSQLEKLELALKQERSKREELDTAHQGSRDVNQRQITELTTQLDAKAKQLKDAELLHHTSITEQNKQLNQQSKTIKTLETKLAEAQQDTCEVRDATKKALVKEETKGDLIFAESQKLQKGVRVMCRIRPSGPQDGALLSYETSEDKSHGKPAGLELISKKGLYGTTTQVDDRTKHYRFDRVFEAHETNADVWLETSQFVQSFIDGRQVTIFCYGPTATGKTYTMSNSSRDIDVDENGDAILTHEGIMPRAKILIFEEARRRKEEGWTVSVRGCCYEVHLREIRLLLPNRVVKTKTLDPTAPPWWHVRDAEYRTLDSVADFDDMFDGAMESRAFTATTSNSSSSVSHFVLYLELEAKSPTMRSASRGSLCLVDLAGSEDPHKSSAPGPDDRGTPSGRRSAAEDAERQMLRREQRLREGIAINQSLRVLRKSIPKIRNPTSANGKPTLEGGDEESSTLAKLLGPCLGRESLVLMFVTINLAVDSLAETKATLESGKEIAEVKQSPKRTVMSEAQRVIIPLPARKLSAIKGSRIPILKS